MNRQLPTSVTWGVGIANPSEAPEFTPCFWWSSCCSIFSFSFCGPFSFGYCIACPSSIYIFWFTLWYLQTPLALNRVANYTSQMIGHLVRMMDHLTGNNEPSVFIRPCLRRDVLWYTNVRLSVRLSVCPSVCLSVRLSVRPSVRFTCRALN